MGQLSDRRRAARARSDEGHYLTKFAQNKYDVEKLKSQYYDVELSSDTLGYALGTRGPNAKRRTVDLKAKTCSCTFWFQHKIPCRHAIAVAAAVGLTGSAADYEQWIPTSVATGYHMEHYLAALEQATVELVDVDALEADGETLPSVAKRQPGRPKKKRIRSKGEAGFGPATKVYKCSKCGEAGHTKRSCLG